MRKKIVIAEQGKVNPNRWVLKYAKGNGYVATTWTGADTFSSKAEAEYYANNHYCNKLTTNIKYNTK